jgi:transmembrane sensor
MSDEQETVAVAGDRWHEAVIWHAHLREASEAEFQAKMQAWKAWEADAENRQVFDEVSRLLEDGARTRRRELPNSEDTNSEPQDTSIPSATWRPPSDPSVARRTTARQIGRGRSPRLRMTVLAGAVAAALVGLLISLPVIQSLWRTAGPNAHSQVHETAFGEVRSDHLEDGSVVTLGAQSEISVQFSAGHRSVTLDRGEAWFQVTHDTTRPFVVTAGPRTITAVGTAFVVQKRADHVVVTVTDGTVEVAPRTSSDAPHLSVPGTHTQAHVGASRVARGEQMSYEDGGSASAVEHADPQAATAWSEGQLEFDHLPLRDVVQVVNRYSHRTITVDQSSGGQMFTGLVLQTQIDEWIRRLPAIYPVEIIEHGDQVCVLGRNEGQLHSPSPCGNSN